MFKVKINTESSGLEFFDNEKKIKELSFSEAKKFLEELEVEKEERGYIFKESEKLEIDDIMDCEDLDDEQLDDLTGLDFGVEAYYRCFPEAHIDFSVIFRDGKPLRLWNVDLEHNISSEEIYFEKVTNHTLRSLLSEDLTEYILNKSGFKILINGEKIDIYNFFDTEKTVTYETFFSSDT